MQIKSAKFFTSAKGASDCPTWELPEFAFIGRSNVGKSSVINMITSKKGLAKVSSTPGKTRMLNFFVMNENWSLVDLPGYGFAKGPRSEKIDFNEQVGNYIEQRTNLQMMFVLIDARREPQKIDIAFTSWLSATGVPFTLVFTKTDKQSAAKTTANAELFLETLTEAVGVDPNAIASSSKTGDGRKEILAAIGQVLDA